MSVCKGCNGTKWIRKWQFGVDGSGYIPAKKDPNPPEEAPLGAYLNGRLIKLACGRCNILGKAEIIYIGREWDSDKDGDLNLKKVEPAPKVYE